MTSPINDESAANLDWTPRAEAVVDDPELPRSIPTPATETAPRGRIIDDSARGTIFWEAEPVVVDRSSSPVVDGSYDPTSDPEPEKPSVEDTEDQPEQPGIQAFGKPFKIEWVSTTRLPFYRTRGLRNPWNANREVKIARDGTELETSVGRRLVQMFQRAAPPAVPQSSGMSQHGLGPASPVPQIPGGYQGMRPY